MRDASRGRGPCGAALKQVIELLSRLSQIHMRIGPDAGFFSLLEHHFSCQHSTVKSTPPSSPGNILARSVSFLIQCLSLPPLGLSSLLSMKEQRIGCVRATASEIQRGAVQGTNYCMERFNQSESKDDTR